MKRRNTFTPTNSAFSQIFFSFSIRELSNYRLTLCTKVLAKADSYVIQLQFFEDPNPQPQHHQLFATLKLTHNDFYVFWIYKRSIKMKSDDILSKFLFI